MGTTKTTDQQHKPTWLLNWFSQLTTNTNTKTQQQREQQQKEQPLLILPWKKDNKKAPPTSSIVITEPISVPSAVNNPTSTHSGSIKTIRNNNNKDKRPSITISLTPSTSSQQQQNNKRREERRNSQQTNYSSSSDQSSSFLEKISKRRDTNSSSLDRSSVLSDLWAKGGGKRINNKKRHSSSSGNASIASSSAATRTRFHWPLHYPHQNNKAVLDETYLRPSSSTSVIQQENNDSSLPSSYRQYPTSTRHLKRHSISSSLINSTTDNTPSCSRPNSILLSQPGSPNLTATNLGNLTAVDAWYLNGLQQYDEYCCQHKVDKKLKWEIKHELTKLAVDGLFSIPEMVTPAAASEKHILQIGCGEASAWGIEVVSSYPKWTVIALDDENPFLLFKNNNSTTKPLPKNFSYMACDDLIQGLINLPDNSFDFISSRFLILEYTLDQYQQLVTECIRICKPGGFIEIMEMDLRIYHQRTLSNSVTQLLNSEVIKVLESKNLDPRLARKLQEVIVDETTVTSFQIKYISLPLGVWGGKLGVMFRDDVHALITSFQGDVATLKEKACRSEDELEYKMDQMDAELDSNRAFMNLHVMVIRV